jgi:hypothetical protein
MWAWFTLENAAIRDEYMIHLLPHEQVAELKARFQKKVSYPVAPKEVINGQVYYRLVGLFSHLQLFDKPYPDEDKSIQSKVMNEAYRCLNSKSYESDIITYVPYHKPICECLQ